MLGWWVVLPRVIERILISQLQSAGFSDVSLQVDHVGLTSASVSEVRLKNGQIRVASLRVDYHLNKLLAGEIEDVTVDGVYWQIIYDQGKLDLGLPPDWLATTDESIPTSTATSGIALPLRQAVLEQATVELKYGNWRWPVILQANLKAGSTGQTATVQAFVSLGGLPVEVQGKIDLLQGNTHWQLNTPGLDRQTWTQTLGENEQLTLVLNALPPMAIDITTKPDGTSTLAMTWDVDAQANWQAPSKRIEMTWQFKFQLDQAMRPTVDVTMQSQATLNLGKWLSLPMLQDATVQADVHLTQGVFTVNAQSQQLGEENTSPFTFDLSMRHDLTQLGQGETRLRLDLPATTLAQWSNELGLTEKLTADGHIALNAVATLDQTLTPKTTGQLRLEAINLNLPDMGLNIENLHGELELASLLTPSTQPRQRINIDTLSYGDFIFNRNHALVSIQNLDDILIEQAVVHPERGGKFLVHAWRYVPDAPMAGELYIENWDVISFLGEATEGRLRGNGKVYGRVPFVFDDGKLTLSTQAWLIGEPGGGRLAVLDKQIRQLILQPLMASQNAPTRLVAERVDEAIGLMQYTYLKAQILDQSDHQTCRIELRGSGLRGEKQEIGSLVVNLNNFDVLLNELLLTPVNERPTMEQIMQWIAPRPRK